MVRLFRWLTPPLPQAAPWPWVIGTAIVTAAMMLAGAWYQIKPAPLPVHVLEHRSMWVDEETWRVETDVRAEGACQIAVTRRFSADGVDFIRPPARSYLDPRKPGDLPYLVAVKPGRGTIWYEYTLPASMVGTEYLIEGTAWACDNGFAGSVGRWLVTVGARP
jgi:hypothetical protein